MLNKFTLTFKAKDLEEDYQNQRMKVIHRPVFFGLTILCSGYQSMKIFVDILRNDVSASYVNFALLSYLLVSFAIGFFNQKYLREYFIITNYVAGMVQYDNNSISDNQLFYLLGSNVMCLHSSLFMLINFGDVIYQIPILLIFRCLSTYFASTEQDFRIYLGAIGISIIQLAILYVCDHSQRSQYLLNIKDRKWTDYLPTLIKQTFFLIKYNEERQLFETISCSIQEKLYIGNMCDGCILRTFLKQAKFEKETLYQHLYGTYLKSHLNDTLLQIKYYRDYYEVNILDFGQQDQKYLMIIRLKEPIKEQITSKKLNYMIKATNLLSKNIEKYVKTPKAFLVTSVYMSCINMQCKVIGKIKFSSYIQNLTLKYNQNCATNIIVRKLEKVEIVSYKYLIKSFLNLLMIQFLRQFEYKFLITIINNKDEVILGFQRLKDPFSLEAFLNTNPQIQELRKYLIKQVIGCNIYFYSSIELPFK